MRGRRWQLGDDQRESESSLDDLQKVFEQRGERREAKSDKSPSFPGNHCPPVEVHRSVGYHRNARLLFICLSPQLCRES